MCPQSTYRAPLANAGGTVSCPPVGAAPSSSVARLSDYGVSFPELLAMLRRENDLRLCAENQARYKQGGYDGYVEVTESIQQQVCCF